MAQLKIGELLRRHRLDLGLTQKEVAEQVGYDNTIVSRVERGELIPSEAFVTGFVENLDLTGNTAEEVWAIYRQSRMPIGDTETKRPFLTDWGEAPDVRIFYGRYEELTTLATWLVDNNCRLVAVLGMGGIGKTALAAKVAKQTAISFDFVIWRSLRNAPPLDEILTELLQMLSNQQEVELPYDPEKAITKIISYLAQHQCLLVLDNVESIMQEGHAGDYREGYGGYGRFFQRVGESDHNSHLLLTSREKPKEIGYLEGDAYPVRVMQLSGLEAEEAQHVLAAKGLSGSKIAVQSLVAHYSGNPLALNLVAEMIREVYAGKIDSFLEDDEVIFGRIGDVIGEQFTRLSPLEQSLIYWLAIEREPVSKGVLLENMVVPVTKRELIIALRSLRRRSLIETNETLFTLQNVVMEYITNVIIHKVDGEIESGRVNILQSHALMKTSSKEFVRQSQERLFLMPICEQLKRFTHNTIIHRSLKLIKENDDPLVKRSYLTGNLLNLLVAMGVALEEFDFSGLVIRQANLRGLSLLNTDFSNTEFVDTTFSESFGPVTAITYREEDQLLITGSITGTIRLWDIKKSKLVSTFDRHTYHIKALAFSPTNKNILVSSSEGEAIRIWDIANQKCKLILRGHQYMVNALQFTTDGKKLISGGRDRTVRIWDIESGKCLKTLDQHKSRIKGLTLDQANNQILVAEEDGTIQFLNLKTESYTSDALKCEGHLREVALSTDGCLLATAFSDRDIHIWDLKKREVVHHLRGHKRFCSALTFSPDNKFLASGSDDQTIRIWDVASGICVKVLNGHFDTVMSMVFTANGKSLISGSWDQTVRIWHIPSWKCVQKIEGFTNWACHIL